MARSWGLGDWARGGFFALLPAAAAAGAKALPVLMAAAGLASARALVSTQLTENKKLPLVLLLALSVWTIASSAWSPFHDHSQAARLAGTVGLGLLFAGAAARAKRPTMGAATAAFAVLVVLLGVETVGHISLNRAVAPGAEYWIVEQNPARGVVVALGLVWALAGTALASGRRIAAAGALLAASACAAQFHQAATLVAFALGLAAFCAGLVAPRIAILLASFGLAAWTLAAPFLTPLLTAQTALIDRLPYSLAARAGIWNYVCAHVPDSPWIGHGLDASRAVTDTIVVRGQTLRAVQLHPHSASLQLWYETGLVGAALAAAALAALGIAAARAVSSRPHAAAIAASLACYGLIANVSFGLWQEWWQASMILAGALLAAAAPAREGR